MIFLDTSSRYWIRFFSLKLLLNIKQSNTFRTDVLRQHHRCIDWQLLVTCILFIFQANRVQWKHNIVHGRRYDYIYNRLFRKGRSRTAEIWKWKILVSKTWTISNTPLGIVVNSNNSVMRRKLNKSITHGSVDKLLESKLLYRENHRAICTTVYISDLCVWNGRHTFVGYTSMFLSGYI